MLIKPVFEDLDMRKVTLILGPPFLAVLGT